MFNEYLTTHPPIHPGPYFLRDKWGNNKLLFLFSKLLKIICSNKSPIKAFNGHLIIVKKMWWIWLEQYLIKAVIIVMTSWSCIQFFSQRKDFLIWNLYILLCSSLTLITHSLILRNIIVNKVFVVISTSKDWNV